MPVSVQEANVLSNMLELLLSPEAVRQFNLRVFCRSLPTSLVVASNSGAHAKAQWHVMGDRMCFQASSKPLILQQLFLFFANQF